MTSLPFLIGKVKSADGLRSNCVTVKEFLKQGKFSAVYLCEKSFDNYSLKICFKESYEVELDVLTNVDYRCAFGRRIVQMFDYGYSNHLDQNFFVYEIFNRSLSDYTSKKPSSRLSALEGLYVLFEYLGALEYLHNRGFVYRNVKPSSLCIESKNGPIFGKRLYLWELESCYRVDYSSLQDQEYIKKMKAIYENRKQKITNGIKYCAIQEHTNSEPAIINDIESWYYIGIKIFEGTLPWSSIKNSEEKLIIDGKKNLNDVSNNFLRHTPVLFTSIFKLIEQSNENGFKYVEAYQIIKKNIMQINKNDTNILSLEEKNFYESILSKRKEILTVPN
uniref:Protein kinase domain-containing protein n=1 Tax=Strongyloides papillosus TaxID=174720 RepID=A0A0N5BA52_STREA